MIDPRPYELALAQAEGNRLATEAQLTQANQDLSRARELLGKNAISQAKFDQAVAGVSELRGQLANLQAMVQRAELDLTCTRVESPIDGLLGQTLVTNGNLVTADSS